VGLLGSTVGDVRSGQVLAAELAVAAHSSGELPVNRGAAPRPTWVSQSGPLWDTAPPQPRIQKR
jgi:hypothetical protein